MNKDLIKQLEEEARRIQERTLPIENEEEEEQETEDIDFEEVGEEESFEVYDVNGTIKEVNIQIRDCDYVLCRDGSWVISSEYHAIDGGIYNPYTENIKHDEWGNAYVEGRDDTYDRILRLKSPDISITEITIASISTINDMDAELEYVIQYNAWVLIEDLEKYNYEVINNVIVKKKSLEEFKEELFQEYPYLEKVIKSIYRDNWDVNYHKFFDSFCLIIKFDEFTITNSGNKSHIIKELYVLMPILRREGKLIISSSMFGGRGLISNTEITQDYKHSHLKSGWDSVTQFCLGTGPINDYILSFNKDPNEHNLFSVLYNVKIYVEWESIEGTPYKYINNIGKGEANISNSFNFDFKDIYKKYIKENKLPVTIYNSGGINHLKIELNILEAQLVKYFPDRKLFKDRTTGKYYNTAILTSITDRKPNGPLLNFKGEDIYTKIYNVEQINVADAEYVVHPSITKSFAENALRRVRDYYFQKISGTDPRKSKYYYI